MRPSFTKDVAIHRFKHAYAMIRSSKAYFDNGHGGHGGPFKATIRAVHERSLLLLGLGCIDPNEPY